MNREKQIRMMAKEEYQKDGEVEIDSNAVISEGEDNGAYVAAWVWVSFEGSKFDKEN